MDTVEERQLLVKNAQGKETCIVKRSGMLVPFRRERIDAAIEAAFRDVRKIGTSDPLNEEIRAAVSSVSHAVCDHVEKLVKKGVSITVEGIQDLVEITLMKKGFHDVARGYIIYRDEHKKVRDDARHNIQVIRNDGQTARLMPMKIAETLEKAFRRHYSIEDQTPLATVDVVNRLTENVVTATLAFATTHDKVHLRDIQDLIETQLMEMGYFGVAKSYIIHRMLEGSQLAADAKTPFVKARPRKKGGKAYPITTHDGKAGEITEEELKERINEACRGLEDVVNSAALIQATTQNFYEGIKEEEIDTACLMAAKAHIETEPAYAKVAARLLADKIYRETLQCHAKDPDLAKAHSTYFKDYLRRGVELKRLDSRLLHFDLDKLASAIRLERDDLFYYMGLQNLYDRYFIHHEEKRLETPQIFWMRVAMGLALLEQDKETWAIAFYNTLSQFHYIASTPTLFNSGTLHSQLSSCYLSTVTDDLHNIFKVIGDNAQLSKWAGGLGNDWTQVRATGARIQGTNGKSQGVIPFLKVANDTAVAVNQCFAPETLLYTHRGVQPISEVKVGDLVLGISGHYREVTETFAYNQQDPMVSIDVYHSLEPLAVTAGHPFYAIQGIPMGQNIEKSLEWIKKGKVQGQWVEAGHLKQGDYIAQVISQEVVPIPGFNEEDARLYGILLSDGDLAQGSMEWNVRGNLQCNEHLEFVRQYLKARGIHFWETGHGDTHLQIHWMQGHGAVRDGSTGRIIESSAPTLPFEYDDIYNAQGQKHIAPRLSHLPHPHALALIQGLLKLDGHVARSQEITFTNTSQHLVEGLRYQCLRLKVPTAGKLRVRHHQHTGKQTDASLDHCNKTTTAYDLKIPLAPEIARAVNALPITKRNWFTVGPHLFTRVIGTRSMQPTPFVYDLKVEGDESYMTTRALAHNGGKRKGALCSYLETWHIDIEDFLELRKNTGDERRRTHDMNTANWIPDLFMKRVLEEKPWTLFSPDEVKELHDLYGMAFEKKYIEYEKKAEEGKIRLFKKVEATVLWRKMLSMLFETGHPWITFKDPSNIRSPQDHVGVVHSSNLCTEILLNTSKDEVAVCNLGSINLVAHTTKEGLNEPQLAQTVRTAIRMLDNVIDLNFYPIEEARNSNLKHRPIGLGLMGFQDALYIQNISYASHEAVTFADQSMEMISYYAILASTELAKERGPYPSYKGSKWDRGILPIDSIDLLEKERGMAIEMDRSHRLNWDVVREAVKRHGMRNSNTMAIAPTATIANIINVSASNEPAYKNLYVKSNLSGEFTIINAYLVEALKKEGLWNAQMVDDLKYYDGALMELERIPDSLKRIFLTAFEIDPEWVIECASRRQKWIDMGQSLNLYLPEPSGKKLHLMYTLAWKKGLKTTYYLRSLGATQIEKSTTDVNARGLQPRWMKNASPSSRIEIERQEGKACQLGESCESCQ